MEATPNPAAKTVNKTPQESVILMPRSNTSLSPIVIATSVNARYALGGFVSLKSALVYAPTTTEAIQVIVLDGGLSKRQWKRLADELGKVGRDIVLQRLVPDLSIFASLPRDYGNSLMAYARLALPWMLPIEYERVLYCDADVVFLRDWSHLWNLELNEFLVGAAVCPVVQTLGGEGLPLEELGLLPEAAYYQSGVMVMDIARWRKERISESALEYLARFPQQARYWDQSALNAVLPGKWLEISEEWNMATFRYHRLTPEQKTRVGIIHYSGPNKPWNFEAIDDECVRFFFDQLQGTVWKDWRPSRLKSHLRLLKYKFDSTLRKNGKK
ncbi:MAG: glycosyltransferase family 8 protein [Puniceicoccaceae bacterium]|nr:MAG: glycosyltransferase family 8 protein [Puniceicoccaceae bacterium]